MGGGATGIGRAAAEALAAAGTHVVLAGRRIDPLTSAAAEISGATGSTVGTLVHDLSRPETAEAALEAAGPFDVLVLNAGGPAPGRIMDVGDKDWRAGVDLLLLGPLALARAAMPG